MQKFYRALICVFVLSFSFSAISAITFKAENVKSISHFRAIPISLSDDKDNVYTRHAHQGKDGYLWLSGSSGIQKYDGYSNNTVEFQEQSKAEYAGYTYLFVDSKGNVWAANSNIHHLNHETGKFNIVELNSNAPVTTISEDKDGNLWFFNSTSDFFKLDTHSFKLYSKPFNNTTIDNLKNVSGSIYDESQNIIWFTSEQGVYGINIITQKLVKVSTEIDDLFPNFLIRDISLDQKRNTLWIGTQKGALTINTKTLQSKIYSADGKPGSLPISEVTTTFIDTAGNVWIGLEKKGFCVFKHTTQSFMCLKTSLEDKYKLPVSTVEDISEDNNGSLWLSMNHSGLFRITPDLEKFSTLRDKITTKYDEYFFNSSNGLIRENKDLWVGTDGGGINIINLETGHLKTLINDPENIHSLSSDAAISLTEDENGYIWVGTWAGGVSKIDPETFITQQYLNNNTKPVDKTILGNNVFVVKADLKGGIWLSVWGKGLQYYNIKEDRFTTYSGITQNESSGITNSYISSFQLYQDQIWILGQAGLEVLDIKTQTFTPLLPTETFDYTHVWVESLEEIWIGSFAGLIRFNSITGDRKIYTTKDGLIHNEINYLMKDNAGQVWIATNNGLSVFDTSNDQFKNYTKNEGLVSNKMSNHSNFFTVDGLLYITTKKGISIVDPYDMPHNNYSPKTMISKVESYNSDAFNSDAFTSDITNQQHIKIPTQVNNIKFEFVGLNFIFPEFNKFKYKLIGFESEFVHTRSNEKYARYTNLSAGNYTFEVYSVNSTGTWDEQGARFSFTILPAWWTLWWAKVLFTFLLFTFIFLVYKWRFALNVKREKALRLKVDDKTNQLQTYAAELKISSESLVNLNSELESRVEQRTAQLQLEVNERKSAESKLFHMAFHDSLTGLPNREWIIQYIDKLLKRCKNEPDFSFGVMFLDGDRFKQINDTLGHVVGDQLLKASSKRLSNLLTDNQYSGRLGGDEFTVITEYQQEDSLVALAHKILEEFKKPFQLDNHTLYFNVSIGLLVCDHKYTEVPKVLRNADIAMYRAKEIGRGNYQLFDKAIQKKTLQMAELEADLRVAVVEGQFELVYQPILDLEAGVTQGFEALIRWNHPEKGIIAPITFIPIAEETGLIWEIGKWVLFESCRQTKQWHDMGLCFLPNISVNLSTNQIRNTGFIDMLDGVIEDTGINPKYLKLELTESVLIENNEALSLLYEALNDRQIDLAIDDFGTGYSSLAYLNEIPVQFLKIDRCFVMAIDQNSDAEINQDALEVVKAVVSLGKSLRKKVVAEGIETQTQLRSLIKHGCDFAQGYFMSKPLSVKDATDVLDVEKTILEGGVNIPKEQYLNEYKIRSEK